MLEHALVAHGAPTLAGLKPGSLFSIFYEEMQALAEEISALNAILVPRGLAIASLFMEGQRALLYLYRKQALSQALAREDARAFLLRWGYRDCSIESALSRLRERIAAQGTFPHEIGVFLGYPLSDVEAFIRFAGRNCLLSGYWKVYSNADEARRLFALYRKCTDVYLRRYRDGFPLSRLAVRVKAA
ncbi:MAG TPA: DUF3793 family protein [Candidatus Alectryocaccomicrobium excrementavium]|uniref:DUF3793 family protein n=1 Tax=Candidatus Alectryocaccomicrobium excrementavium TaxID=2840668 RepID=A0A9D1G143_9FIRM|nr:DUF3793 family protein [Candidatus Alectryocaccomicrobium excrementavium]